MMNTNKPHIRLGRDATVIESADGPLIISGGVPYLLMIGNRDEDSEDYPLILRGDHLPDIVIARGSAVDIHHAYSRLLKDIRRTTSRWSWPNVVAIAVGAGLAMAISIAAVLPIPSISTSGTDVIAPSVIAPSSKEDDLSRLLELIPLLNMQNTGASSAEDGADAIKSAGEPLPVIQKRPDFLKEPVLSPPVAPETTTKAGADEVEEPAEIDLLSSLQPYQAVTAQEPAVAASDEDEVETTAPATDEEASREAEKKPEPIPDENTASVKPEADSSDSGELSAKEVEDKTRTAAAALVNSGMAKEEALDVLEQLEAIGNMSADEITPEILASLPHEVAKTLVDIGLVDPDAITGEDGVPYAIIRLPEEVIDEYRGDDGIASIPERNSWISTGNRVSIPLPGGGDIKKPSDLEDFFLQP